MIAYDNWTCIRKTEERKGRRSMMSKEVTSTGDSRRKQLYSCGVSVYLQLGAIS
jgi:hypothetical protein